MFLFFNYFLHYDTVIIFSLDSEKIYASEEISQDFK